MKTCERIRVLRLDLGLTQLKFGERLGVSRSVVNNLERDALVNGCRKQSLIKLISKEFSVSEQWLLSGETPYPEYTAASSSDICTFLQSHGATREESHLMAKWLSYSPAKRKDIIYFMEQMVKVANDILDNRPSDDSSEANE